MNILLFSSDKEIIGFCRETLGELFGPEADLEVARPGQLPSKGDLCLWDFVPGETRVPQDLAQAMPRKLMFLAHREHLPLLQDLVGCDVNVLLKPITSATLRAFLDDTGDGETQENGDRARNADTLRVERDEMLQFLIQANLKLQEYDQERTNFLARSIHDFRAPLTAITGYCELLLEEELGPVTLDQREVLERMQHSAARLSRITNSMFQLSVRQHVDRELNLEKAEMRDCVDQSLHEVALFLEDKRITIKVEIETPPDGLFFDKSQMEQTLVNLLDNACRFTPRNGTIEIKGYPFFWERRNWHAASGGKAIDRRVKQIKAPNSFRVDIRDSGPGIPAPHTDKIFEEYTSYCGGQDRSGGGLGLAICRMILQRHRGKVWAESHDTGAVFSFVLPVRPSEAPASAQQAGSARIMSGRV